MPLVVLSATAGLQVPEIPLVELAGREGTDSPAQMVREVPNAKAGVIFGFTVTVKVAGKAHWPASGVKV